MPLSVNTASTTCRPRNNESRGQKAPLTAIMGPVKCMLSLLLGGRAAPFRKEEDKGQANNGFWIGLDRYSGNYQYHLLPIFLGQRHPAHSRPIHHHPDRSDRRFKHIINGHPGASSPLNFQLANLWSSPEFSHCTLTLSRIQGENKRVHKVAAARENQHADSKKKTLSGKMNMDDGEARR